ncbi:MAG TPA: Type 1 glutamine amidotransferase-like domain-containing protein [Candidatus Saccharimonadales bacterium]
MRLYLSSHGFGNHLERLQQMVGDNKKVLFIDNAKDDLSEDERQAHVAEKRLEFEEAGFEFYELDLRKYFGKAELLSKIVAGAGLVWVSGGNTFLVRRALKYSGLDEILMNDLRKDLFVYGGSSAGAIIMTKTLRGTEMGDDPYVAPEGYEQEIIWNGLGMIYPQLVPHYQSSWFGNEAQAMIDYFEENGLKYKGLKDGEVYVVDGEFEERLE